MTRRLIALTTLIFALVATRDAHAESGRLNLHLDLGVGVPLAGPLQIGRDANAFAILGWFSLDYQPFSPLSFELIGGAGYLTTPYPQDEMEGASGTIYGTVGLGVRLRFMDNRVGYLNEPEGDHLGNFWGSLHLGYHHLDGHQFGFDGAIGYEFSVVKPLQLGIFARVVLTVAGENDGVDSLGVIGVNGSIELFGRTEALDRDGDGLPDEREINEYGTDPNNPDTDGDGLSDRAEIDAGTNPLVADSDGDGLSDGEEDSNGNGRVDAGESDPRSADTDGGGVEDGYERQNGTNPEDASDDDEDGDGVLNHLDACPGTADGTEIDERGCAVIRAQMVLPGITFGFDSAEILPESERTLNIALQILTDNPDANVEVGGHSDNQGSRAHNMRLSRQRAEAVKAWLVEHGIDASRLSSRGYGPTQPAGSNDTEEGRAQNRRIEFTRTN